jgi:hypothetical protein
VGGNSYLTEEYIQVILPYVPLGSKRAFSLYILPYSSSLSPKVVSH